MRGRGSASYLTLCFPAAFVSGSRDAIILTSGWLEPLLSATFCPRPFASTLTGFWEKPYDLPEPSQEGPAHPQQPWRPPPPLTSREDTARGPGSGGAGGSRGAGAVLLSRVVPPLPNPPVKPCGCAGGRGRPFSAPWDRLTREGRVAESVSVPPRTTTSTTWAIP